jgi:ADP-heptose:LPS heptosyltransferase
MFIGIDSFPIHVAGAMKTPRIGLFGVTTSKYILCDSPDTVVVSSDPAHQFTGYRHKVNSMNQIVLKRPNDNPMHTISPEKVWSAFTKFNDTLIQRKKS